MMDPKIHYINKDYVILVSIDLYNLERLNYFLNLDDLIS